MEPLKFEDFKEEQIDGLPPYYTWNDGEVKICLEPCFAGMCVGIYDADDWILAEKKCTHMPGYSPKAVQDQAVNLANLLYQTWRSKNVIE